MKTSPTERRRGERGFTLVELMVVVVIIGLAASAAVLSLPAAGGGVVAEAERFAARAAAARDQALIGNRAVALTVDGGGYLISTRSDAGWVPGAPQPWGEGIAAEVRGARTVFDPTGLADPLSVTLRGGRTVIGVDIGHDGAVALRR